MRELEWLRVIAAAHAAGVDTRTDSGITVRRVSGGNNDALYRVEADGQIIACKLCVADERRRAAHEYAALHALDAAKLDIAPEPLWLDESCQVVPYPVVAYRWLPGESHGPSITDAQLDALLASVQLMHTLEPAHHPELTDSWFHWFDFSLYLSELDGFLNHYGPWLETDAPDGRDLSHRLMRLLDDCKQFVATTRVKPDREQVALRLCRADTNLSNAIWNDDDHVRWVDWEYSGRGDPALEMAELRWHAAMIGLSDQQHDWLRAHYQRPPGDDYFDERLAAWDRIITTRWCFLMLRALWSAHNGPDRVRLSRLPADPAQLRARLIQFIERAERLAAHSNTL